MAHSIPDVQGQQEKEKREQREQEVRERAMREERESRPRPQHQRPAQHPGQERKSRREDNVIYIGKKPTMSYVLAVMTQLQNNMGEIHVKARGRSISRAVDVVEVVRNRFVQDIKREISIGTETIEDRDRNRLNVSTIDIRMVR